jgi:hypothetical protein
MKAIGITLIFCASGCGVASMPFDGKEVPQETPDGSAPPVTMPKPDPPAATDGGTPATTTTPHSVMLIPGTTITGNYFDTMAARLTADGWNPVVFVPPDLFTDSLALGGTHIGEAVDAQLAKTGEKRLSIVAECDGGVATRYWLELLGGDARVDQVITFVSAHHGTWESPVGSWVTDWQALKDITPGSDFMNTLNAAPFPNGLHLTSIYSCNDELMVPYTTSVVDGATNVLFCEHYIDHFGGFWDDVVYSRILTTLQGHGDTAPTSY